MCSHRPYKWSHWLLMQNGACDHRCISVKKPSWQEIRKPRLRMVETFASHHFSMHFGLPKVPYNNIGHDKSMVGTTVDMAFCSNGLPHSKENCFK